ncbi:hypothetical protein K438DRAFT_1962208 [Mycena galopus ATCC 62051]|nr:hypothetical protein K438DRAFT_1962208 [Mycena galopus ATCC 62051]
MSDSDESQNEAQFGMTGGFQFVAYTLDVALWGAAMNYKDLILLFGNYEAQNIIINEDNVMLGSVFVVAFTAQMFYASRIWMLTRPRWNFVAPVIFLATLQFAAGIVYGRFFS